MKSTEKAALLKPAEMAALLAAIGGVAAGFGLAWLLKDASVWLYLGFGLIVGAGLNHEIGKALKPKRTAEEA